MKTGSKIIIIGCILIIIGLPLFLLYGKLLPHIFLVLMGIFWIVWGLFKNKGYFNKTYYMAIFGLIELWGLMLLYTFLFRNNEYLRSIYIFYILVGLFIFLLIRFGVFYIRKHKELNL
ncbi:MAG: hypothetical protein A4E27_00565 [Methanobacterium sp. PtaU1.Bin242]|jgi:uncharacterized membrane protein HdeD (DUF308 family)|nr:MAG: hypothetical protein A4E27_00565 [Methanobacterium sp. PtaU1.Bin242]